MVNYYIFHDRQIARFNIEYFKPKWGGGHPHQCHSLPIWQTATCTHENKKYALINMYVVIEWSTVVSLLNVFYVRQWPMSDFCQTVIKECRSVLHHCVVILFWSSGIMDYMCFTFGKRVQRRFFYLNEIYILCFYCLTVANSF